MKKYDPKNINSQGIVIGFNKIPVDSEVLASMKNYAFDPDYVSKCLEANRHNNVTTTYYLSLKKYIREGGVLTYDHPSKSFDKSIIDTNRRKNTIQNVILDNFFTRNS